MDKYKEIVHKGNENTSKSQQYLDGLLKIPFEIFKKEHIIIFLNEFKLKISNFLIYLNQETKSYEKDITLIENNHIDNLKKCSIEYSKKILTSKNINYFLKDFGEIIDIMVLDNNSAVDISDPTILLDLLNQFDKKHKISQYKQLIKYINTDLDKLEIDIIISDKGRKKELKQNIFESLNKITNIQVKKRYLYLLQN